MPAAPQRCALMRPYVLLEVGRARVTPFVERTITSWVHDVIEANNIEVPRPVIKCVHPLVTLLEKASALQSRIQRDIDRAYVEPARYVRHFEDAVHIIRAYDAGKLPPLPDFESPRALAAELVRTKDTQLLNPNHPAFNPASSPDRA